MLTDDQSGGPTAVGQRRVARAVVRAGRRRAAAALIKAGGGVSSSTPVAAVSAAGLVLVMGLAVVIFSMGSQTSSPNLLATQVQFTSGGAVSSADVPPVVYAAYAQAAAQAGRFHPDCALRPAVLAGIGWRESVHGTIGGAAANTAGNVSPPIIGIPLNGTNGTAAISDTDGGTYDADTVWDRAVGPMQFIPSSWRSYGADGNGDGVADPQNIYDAALAAVAHLCASSPVNMNTSQEALRSALFAYNRSGTYVSSVFGRIGYYDIAFSAPAMSSGDAQVLLRHPNLVLSEAARADLVAGIVDPRVIAVLAAIVQNHDVTVGVFQTGHSQCIGGSSRTEEPLCSESHHYHGRAVDISVVAGQPVGSNNSAARGIVRWLSTLPVGDPIRPNVGSPWAEFSALPGFFTDAHHQHHIHLGFCGPRWKRGVWEDSCA